MTDETAHDPEDAKPDWLDALADAAVDSGPAAEETPADALPPVDRPRPVRPALVPVWVWWGLGAVAAVAVVALAVTLVLRSTGNVSVPDVTGADLSVAQTRLAQVDLKARVVERRFSEAPADEVLEQRPSVGARVKRGDVIELVVSAGNEEFLMPDVVGNGIALARGVLETKGLVVVIEPVVSDAASDTVLASMPAAGATVRTGDTVRLQVATPSLNGGGLKPYALQGLSVVIDPAPMPRKAGDPTLEVSRRVRALLEAAGARVVELRTVNDTATAPADRAKRAAAATSTIAVGFSVAEKGSAGRVIAWPGAGASVNASAQVDATAKLASRIASELAGVASPVSALPMASDQVLAAASPVWVRITLGSLAQRDDTTSFADPRWIDSVARAIYEAIGSTYGVAVTP